MNSNLPTYNKVTGHSGMGKSVVSERQFDIVYNLVLEFLMLIILHITFPLDNIGVMKRENLQYGQLLVFNGILLRPRQIHKVSRNWWMSFMNHGRNSMFDIQTKQKKFKRVIFFNQWQSLLTDVIYFVIIHFLLSNW